MVGPDTLGAVADSYKRLRAAIEQTAADVKAERDQAAAARLATIPAEEQAKGTP